MKNVITIAFVLFTSFSFGQIIDINANFKHTVGGMDSLNRKQMIKIHADNTEPDWLGWNFQNFEDLRDTLLNFHDIYLGRNTGGVSWHFNQVNEDPNRSGYADTVDLAARGQISQTNYANNTAIHSYDINRNELVIATQQRPFFNDGTPTTNGWQSAGGAAVGEYLAKYIEYFHSPSPQREPAYVEIMNEPLYDFVTMGNYTPADIFSFHNDAADAFKQHNTTTPLGGYVAAFPDFEKNDFQRWNDRMKLFMDMSGSKIDFWSIHLYDFNSFWAGGFSLRRGANLEATFDMMEHYSQLSFNEVKPFVISEYGGRVLGSEHLPWSPYRDWMNLKSYTSMLLTFMDRPQHIVSAIPFITLKAEWGTQSNGNPYPWRMMRKDNELAGQTGNYWVFTELIKFYQMLKEVKGTRVDTNTSDPDIQTNAFVNGNKLYLIVNNLYFNDATVHLNMIENNGNAIQNINVKHLHLNAAGDAPLLDDNNYTLLDSLVIGTEGAMVIEYTFQNNVIIDELVDETKYYADQHLTAIIPYANHTFNINGVTKGNGGEAILRLGLGRDHGLTLQPTVKINGYTIEVPTDHKGYDQLNKDSWFGVIEIPVPYYYIQADNEITVKFDEAGGHISSMALQVYNNSNSIYRSDSVHVSALTIAPSTKDLAIGTSYQLTPTITPLAATDHTLVWTSSDNNIATVDDLGNVSAIALGTVTIAATTVDGGLTATSIINVLNTVPSVLVSNLTVSPETFTLEPGQFVQLNTTLSPIDADDKTITWTTSAPNIISISNTGMVQGQFEGTVEVIATTNDGSNLSDTSTITVQTAYSTFIQCFFLPSMLNQDTVFNISADYSTGYPSNIILELHDVSNNVVASGQSFVPAGIGSTNVRVSASTAPAVGTNYSLHAFIENAIADSIIADCEKTNVEVTFAVSTFSVELTGIQLFPNPSQGELALEVPYLKDEMTVTVFDMMGRVIRQQTIHQTVNRIDLNGVASGMYLIQIKNDEASRTERVIIR